ncbi:hypothetical protein V8E55_006590, partial [Tylopilus felleus]
FTLPRVTVYRVICEHLESMDRMTDAVECLHKITNDMGEEVYASEPTIEWVCDFTQYCSEKLGHLGDTAMDAQQHDEAISYYTTALSLGPACPQNVLIRRSKAWLATGEWEKARDDADQVHHFYKSFVLC